MIKPTNTRVNWRATKYKNIMVSDTGEVWNYRLGRTVKNKSKPGISPQINVDRRCITIARIVYETFVGEVPDGYIVVHKDHIIENNFVGNLGVMSRSEYQPINNRNNGGLRVEIRNEQGDPIKRYKSVREFCRKNYIGVTTVNYARNGKTKKSQVVPENVVFYRRQNNHELMKGE